MTKPIPTSLLLCPRAYKQLFIALCNRCTECSLLSTVWIQLDAVNMTRAPSTAIIPIPANPIPCNIEVMNTSNCHQNEQQIFSLCLNWKVPTAVQLCPHIKYGIHWDGVYYTALSVDIYRSVVKKREERGCLGMLQEWNYRSSRISPSAFLGSVRTNRLLSIFCVWALQSTNFARKLSCSVNQTDLVVIHINPVKHS
jgi:hypothetical protein